MSLLGTVVVVVGFFVLLGLLLGGCYALARYAPDETAPAPRDPRPQAPGPSKSRKRVA